MKTDVDLLKRFEAVLRSQKLSSMTVRAYMSAVRKFTQSIEELNVEEILKWAETTAEGRKPSTVNLYYCAIRRFLEEVSPEILLDLRNKLKVKGRSSTIPKALSEREFLKLWNKAVKIFDEDYRQLLIVGLAGYAGLRVSEIRSLKVGHINLREDHILVNGKGRKMRIVPIPSKLKPYIFKIVPKLKEEESLLKNLSGKPITSHGISYLLKNLAKKTGIKHISPHVLRHTAATNLLKKGVNLKIVQEFLGHSSLATTERYLRVTINDMKENLRKAGY